MNNLKVVCKHLSAALDAIAKELNQYQEYSVENVASTQQSKAAEPETNEPKLAPAQSAAPQNIDKIMNELLNKATQTLVRDKTKQSAVREWLKAKGLQKIGAIKDLPSGDVAAAISELEALLDA